MPCGIGPYMINSEYEIGHFEACTSVRGKGRIKIGKVNDTFYNHCAGPYETATDTAARFEPNDAPCFKAGDTHGGIALPNLVAGCDVFFNAIGDLEYDGSPYYADWPASTKAGPFPTPFLQQQPTTVGGHGYAFVQFITDASATEFNTNCKTLITGSGCVLPPNGPGHFYPYFTQAIVNGKCVWEFGNMRNGASFGRAAQYGSVGLGTVGAFVGPIRLNPHC